MATRPIFIPQLQGESLVQTIFIDFEWFAGLHVSQKQKSIRALHQAYLSVNPEAKILEISSKSELSLGIQLSAFNLKASISDHQHISVESVFQSAKVFANGGPYLDLLTMSSKEAKKDQRLQNSGQLIAFEYQETRWSLQPQTAFYDWIYLNALNLNQNLQQELLHYTAFTDIEFNPKKSINCQAYAAALYVALIRRQLLTQNTIPAQTEFIRLIQSFSA